jgi:hypothetical protein
MATVCPEMKPGDKAEVITKLLMLASSVHGDEAELGLTAQFLALRSFVS